MATLVVKHPVQDYAAWKVVYEEVADLRRRHGCTGDRILRDSADPNTLLVLHEFPSVAGAQSFAADPELGSAMQRAGVAAPPVIEFYEAG